MASSSTKVFQESPKEEVIGDEKRQRHCFWRRKATMMKKANELSVLCGIPVCVVCFGPDGNVDTWPKNHTEVENLINRYNDFSRNGGKRIQKVEETEKIKLKFPSKKLDGLSEKQLVEFLKFLDSKLSLLQEKVNLELQRTNMNLDSNHQPCSPTQMMNFDEQPVAANPIMYLTPLPRDGGYDMVPATIKEEAVFFDDSYFMGCDGNFGKFGLMKHNNIGVSGYLVPQNYVPMQQNNSTGVSGIIQSQNFGSTYDNNYAMFPLPPCPSQIKDNLISEESSNIICNAEANS